MIVYTEQAGPVSDVTAPPMYVHQVSDSAAVSPRQRVMVWWCLVTFLVQSTTAADVGAVTAVVVEYLV